MVIPTVIALLSLVLYPNWPLELLANLQNAPPDTKGNIPLWRQFGAYALLLWLPPLFLPMKKDHRLAALAAALGLAMPYFQQTDLLALFVLPVGWLTVLLGNLGYLFLWYEWGTFAVFWVIPAFVYLQILLTNIRMSSK
jgi:hypothetical protein